MTFWRRLRSAIRSWWQCRTKRCSYYTHYQVYGPCDLSHAGWHQTERMADAHFRNCHHDYEKSGRLCATCLAWEKRVRA